MLSAVLISITGSLAGHAADHASMLAEVKAGKRLEAQASWWRARKGEREKGTSLISATREKFTAL
jgi:hypothetical protein